MEYNTKSKKVNVPLVSNLNIVIELNITHLKLLIILKDYDFITDYIICFFRIVQLNKIKMGCVGGTIPTIDELVKAMKRPERKDKVSGRSY